MPNLRGKKWGRFVTPAVEGTSHVCASLLETLIHRLNPMKTTFLLKQTLSILAISSIALCAATEAQAGKRVALVIGNDNYQHASRLNAAVNDARAVALALEQLNFTVVKVENAGIGAMHEALDRAKVEAPGADAFLFYYAGHGIESDEVNYLIPVDAKLERETELKFQTLSLDGILDEVKKLEVKARMLILDCCRDNPLQGSRSWASTRSAGGGMGSVTAEDLAEATLVMYSASPGKPALDRVSDSDRHSPFTTALLEQLPKPGVHSFETFCRVEESVRQRTSLKQCPLIFYNGSSIPFRNFAFDGSGSPYVAQPIQETPPPPISNLNTNWAAQANVIASSPPVVALPLATTEFLSLDELFEGTDYADYNGYSKKGILAKAQEKLKKAGVYLDKVDGETGPKTHAAINTWQRSRGLPVTGRLDAETQASLDMPHMDEMFPPANTQRTRPNNPQWQPPPPPNHQNLRENIEIFNEGLEGIQRLQGIFR
jgi:hypothetical protein